MPEREGARRSRPKPFIGCCGRLVRVMLGGRSARLVGPGVAMTGNRGIAHFVCGRRAKWVVLALWLVVLFLTAPLASKLTDAQDNDAASWLPGSAESTQVLQLSEDFRPEQIPAVVVYARESGLTPQERAAIAKDTAEIKQLTAHGIRGSETRGPIYDRQNDPRAAQILIPITMDEKGWQEIAPAVDSIRDVVGKGGDGLAVHITGPGGTSADFSKAFEGIDSTLLLSAMGVAIVTLLITFRSPTLLLIPLLSVVAALFTARPLLSLPPQHAGRTVNAKSAGILTVLVFGAGTDYALLLVARYREELHRHEDRHEAMAFALHRATPAIIASALTVILGMLCLFFAEMNSTSGLGPVAAIGIGVGLLVMITLLPALLVIFGRWIFWPRRPAYDTVEPSALGFWARTGARIAPRPRLVWVVTTVVLGVCSLGILQLNAHGLATEDSYTKDFDSVTGQQVLIKHQLGDTATPVQVVANADQAQAVSGAMQDLDGIGDPSPPVVKGGVALIQASVESDPTSKAAFATVDRVRDAVHQVPGADALVGGGTAINTDIEQASMDDNKVIIPLVLIVVMLVLMVLLRALLSPLILVATVVLSFGASLGLSALIFRHVFGFAGADASLPLFVFVFLVALGIDYNIFLMTRVREETPQHGTRRASLIALGATGGVITSAGLVLAATFSVLATLPLVAFAEIGFAVALGVLLDTLIVRSVLVTAINLDVGSKIWWPSKLDRGDEPSPVQAAEQVEALEG